MLADNLISFVYLFCIHLELCMYLDTFCVKNLHN